MWRQFIALSCRTSTLPAHSECDPLVTQTAAGYDAVPNLDVTADDVVWAEVRCGGVTTFTLRKLILLYSPARRFVKMWHRSFTISTHIKRYFFTCGNSKVGKGKVHTRTGHGGPEGSSSLSLTSALDGVGGQHHTPTALFPGQQFRYPFYRMLVGPRVCLDGCGKSRPYRDSISEPSSPSIERSTFKLQSHNFNLEYYMFCITFILAKSKEVNTYFSPLALR